MQTWALHLIHKVATIIGFVYSFIRVFFVELQTELQAEKHSGSTKMCGADCYCIVITTDTNNGFVSKIRLQHCVEIFNDCQR